MKNLALWFCLVWLVSCQAPQPQGPPAAKLQKTYQDQSGQVRLTLGISEESLSLFDRLRVTYLLEYHPQLLPVWPLRTAQDWSPLQLAAPVQEDHPPSSQAGWLAWRQTYELEALTSGPVEIPPLVLYYRLPGETPNALGELPLHEIKTEAMQVTFLAPSGPPPGELKPIKGLILPPFRPAGLLVAVAVILLGLALGWVVHQRKGKPAQPEPPFDLDAFLAQTLHRLEALGQAPLEREEDFIRLFQELSNLLRHFIEVVFSLPAKEQTTEEFLQTAGNSGHFLVEEQGLLQAFLHLADLVKFATYEPGVENTRLALQHVQAFVQTTSRRKQGGNHGI